MCVCGNVSIRYEVCNDLSNVLITAQTKNCVSLQNL